MIELVYLLLEIKHWNELKSRFFCFRLWKKQSQRVKSSGQLLWDRLNWNKCLCSKNLHFSLHDYHCVVTLKQIMILFIVFCSNLVYPLFHFFLSYILLLVYRESEECRLSSGFWAHVSKSDSALLMKTVCGSHQRSGAELWKTLLECFRGTLFNGKMSGPVLPCVRSP